MNHKHTYENENDNEWDRVREPNWQPTFQDHEWDRVRDPNWQPNMHEHEWDRVRPLTFTPSIPNDWNKVTCPQLRLCLRELGIRAHDRRRAGMINAIVEFLGTHHISNPQLRTCMKILKLPVRNMSMIAEITNYLRKYPVSGNC